MNIKVVGAVADLENLRLLLIATLIRRINRLKWIASESDHEFNRYLQCNFCQIPAQIARREQPERNGAGPCFARLPDDFSNIGSENA